MNDQTLSEGLTANELRYEEQVRKRWLRSFVLMFLPAVFILMLYVWGIVFSWHNIVHKVGFWDIAIIALGIILPIVEYGSTYYHAYKTRGTAWSQWLLSLGFIWTFICLSWVISKQSIAGNGLTKFTLHVGECLFSLGAWAWLIPLILCMIAGNFLLNCRHLYQVNKRRKNVSNAQISPEYSSFVFSLETATDLESLNVLFFQAVEKNPQWEEQLSFVYNRRKKLLQQN